MDNHLNVLYQLVDRGDIDSAKNYIKEISQPIRQLSKRVWTGVDIVDVLINSKVARMEQKGIGYQIQAEFPAHSNISSKDICTVLSNLLDNAIEAVERWTVAENVQKSMPVIRLKMRKINQFLMIQISNPCVPISGFNERNHVTENKVMSTTKPDKELHGWGLKSVITAVEKYDGTFGYECKDGLFTATAMLFFEHCDTRA